jgi:hypothetical protein
MKGKGPEVDPKVGPKKKTGDEPLLGAPTGTQVMESTVGKVKDALDEGESLKKKSVSIQADEATLKKMLAAYRDFYKADEDWLKKNPGETKDGKLNLSFKSDEDLTKFLKSQADAKQSFILVDAATQKVIAFSNGDGKLYKLDKDGKPNEYDSKNGPLIPKPEEMAKLPDLGKPGTEGAFKMPTPAETAKLDKSTAPKLGGEDD